MKNESKGWRGILLTAFLTVLAVFFLIPVFLVLMNSLKGQFYISDAPFALPNSETFVGLRNYWNGIEKVDFFSAFGYSAFITLFSVAAIVLFTAMTAWYLVRAGTRAANGLYYLFVFSMIVPFQMVMFTMSKMANLLHLDNPVGIILLYLGFGSGLSVFLYSGFIKSIPLDVEEAAMIDGCRPWQTFFFVVFPILKPTAITVAILNAMWIWNDYLLPLSGNRQPLPHHSHRSTVSAGRLRIPGHGRADGHVGAGDYPHRYFLSRLSEIYYPGRDGWRGQGMIRGLTCIDAGIDWFDGKAPREYDNGRKCYEESLIKP